MLDLHTHILPHMDDGSKNCDQSITMLRKEKEQGVSRVVCTPHFYADKEAPEAFLKRRDGSMQALRQTMAECDDLPQVLVGAEVAYYAGISRSECVDRLCIGNTRALLIEMPFCEWTQSVVDEIIFLKDNRDLQPIVAHIERYMRYQSPGICDTLCDAGIWIQANTSFFTQWQTSRKAIRMLKEQRIQFLGTDCHDTVKRPPDYGEAVTRIEKRLGKDAIDYLNHMGQNLLEGGMR